MTGANGFLNSTSRSKGTANGLVGLSGGSSFSNCLAAPLDDLMAPSGLAPDGLAREVTGDAGDKMLRTLGLDADADTLFCRPLPGLLMLALESFNNLERMPRQLFCALDFPS